MNNEPFKAVLRNKIADSKTSLELISAFGDDKESLMPIDEKSVSFFIRALKREVVSQWELLVQSSRIVDLQDEEWSKTVKERDKKIARLKSKITTRDVEIKLLLDEIRNLRKTHMEYEAQIHELGTKFKEAKNQNQEILAKLKEQSHSIDNIVGQCKEMIDEHSGCKNKAEKEGEMERVIRDEEFSLATREFKMKWDRALSELEEVRKLSLRQ